MKKSVLVILVVLSMLAVFAGPVAAAPLASGTATLVSVEYISSGPVFTFHVNGEFSKADLKGSLHIENGDDLDLYCTQVDPNMVKCFASKQVGGKKVVLSWGGQTFWTSVPNAPAQSCYNVYDWNTPSPFTSWVNYGTACQNEPAQYGDVINWYNPGWGYSYYYQFLPKSPNEPSCTTSPITGDAYYYPSCPSSSPN